jgi:F0F1-type ATP synthase assembly protein I
MKEICIRIKELTELDHPVVTGTKGVIGVGATSTGWCLSALPEIEAWLRIVSLLIGIGVGVLTLLSLLHTVFSRGKKRRSSGG